MTQEERQNLINTLIIDNNTMQVSPAKIRQVLLALNESITITEASAVTALTPLNYNAFTNVMSIQKVSALQDGYLSKEDYSEFKAGIIPDVSGLVPYTGATTNVDLGEFQIKTGQLEFDTTPTGTFGVGKVRWNDTDGTIEVMLKGGNVTLQVGQEQVLRVVNKTGGDLLESGYHCVYISGAQGNRLKVDLALSNNTVNSNKTIGLVTENINNNLEGFITTSGLVRNINTTGSIQGETWIDGDVLYLSDTIAGHLTNVPPTSPNHKVIAGYVVRAHATQGNIFVKVDTGLALSELHDVKITSTTANKVIGSITEGLWENKTIPQLLGYTPVGSSGTTNRIPKFNSSTTLGDSALIQVGGNIGLGSAVVPGELFHIGDGNILLEGGGEVAQKFKRDFSTTGENLGVPTGSGVSVNPIFQIGRIIQAGDGDPEIRIMYSDDNTVERTVFEVDRKGIAASVKTSIGSHFEGFASLTDVNPMFRLNSYPRMRLEMGAGGNNITDVAVERGASGELAFFTNSTKRGEFDSSGNLSIITAPTTSASTYDILTRNTSTGKVEKVDSSGVGSWTTTGNDIYNSNSGNIGIGTVTPAYKLDVRGDMVAGVSPVYVSHFKPNYTTPSSGSYEQTVIKLRPSFNIPSGVSQNGLHIGVYSSILRDNVLDAGTLAYLHSVAAIYGHLPNATGHTESANGVTIHPYHQGGSIGTSKALYLENSSGGITPTNYWAIYQEDSLAKNYFSGRNLIGTTTDNGVDALQVTGSVGLNTAPTTSAGGYDILTRNTSTGKVEKVSSGVTPWTTTGNDIANSNSGNVGIGTVTPPTGDARLVIKGTGTGNTTFSISALNSSGSGVFSVDDQGNIANINSETKSREFSATRGYKVVDGMGLYNTIFPYAGYLLYKTTFWESDIKLKYATDLSGSYDARTLVDKGYVDSKRVQRLAQYTVSTLPTGAQGDTAYVTDALAPTYMATVVGGGAVVTPVFHDGTNWVAH